MSSLAITDKFLACWNALNIPVDAPVAVAVSGGPDSMALAVLLKTVYPLKKIVALTVDHGLRPEAAQEAETVKNILNSHGIETQILSLQLDATDATGVMERAREARYSALMTACQAAGIDYLVTAHHADDQIEGFFHRLIAGTGTQGLSVMMPRVKRDGVYIVRPLLSFQKNELIEFLNAKNHPFIQDPSNHNPDFTRVRLRHFIKDLKDEGLHAERVLTTINRIARANDALDTLTQDWITHHVSLTPWLGVSFNTDEFRACHPEIKVRVWVRLFQMIKGEGYDYPRLSSIEDALKRYADQNTGVLTVMGCVVDWTPTITVIGRESAAVKPVHITRNGRMVWDNRIDWACDSLYQVRAYEEGDAAFLKQKGDADFFAAVPARYRPSLPVILDDKGQIVAARFLGFVNPAIDERALVHF